MEHMTTVQAILGLKGGDVATADPGHTLGHVVGKLAELRIGAMVVSDEARNVIGIISERDVVKMIAAHGASVLQEPVAKFMTRSVQTCTRKDTVDELMEMMTRGRFRHVPVVEGGKLVGIVSIGDVVKHKIEEAEHEAEVLREYIAS
jgi:CBS domain-containing protein